jgi:hypothetical protein
MLSASRQDVLDTNLFANLMEVKLASDDFEEDYNHRRPGSILKSNATQTKLNFEPQLAFRFAK